MKWEVARGGPAFSGVVAALGLFSLLSAPAAAQSTGLRIETIGSDSTSFSVTATLIIGATEVVLWDAMYILPDAERVADRIAATGRRLTTIVLSHPDHDHYASAAAIAARFPGVPIYMTAAGIEYFEHDAPPTFAREKQMRPELFPDRLVTPRPLPSLKLHVDGHELEIIPDLAGDVIRPTNSILWIPSLRTVLASDLVFDGVHPWLGNSDEASRGAWRQALGRIRALDPVEIVAGHKFDPGAPNAIAQLDFMDRYLGDFEELRASGLTEAELVAAMTTKYPQLTSLPLLTYGVRMVLRDR